MNKREKRKGKKVVIAIRVKDKVCQEVERRQDKGKANDEWLYSGSTVGLQWVYSGSTVALQWVYSGSTVALQ